MSTIQYTSDPKYILFSFPKHLPSSQPQYLCLDTKSAFVYLGNID